jgi:hypothetical protein
VINLEPFIHAGWVEKVAWGLVGFLEGGGVNTGDGCLCANKLNLSAGGSSEQHQAT